jgi:multiple sugar transport system ATP-binding protein
MAHLSIKDLSNRFGDIGCLDKVSLEIDDGELAVIVGPSGCGKTTLMRCIVGLETFLEGSIFIDDELINDKEPKDRDVAMVFQYYALYPHMTVLQNLSLGLEHTTSLTKDEIQRRVEEIAGTLRISGLLERKPAQLSGGESQRVAIGRALVRKPRVFLLDEPLSAVDAKLRRELRTEIKRIQRGFGVTTIYVTHDQEEAMAVGDKLVVLRDGRIHQVGTPEEVFNRPKDQFVARFIGKPPMNFLETRIRNEDNKHFLENREFSYEISSKYYERYLSNLSEKALILGIRPSSIRITPQKTPSLTTTTNIAIVSLIENVGNDNYIHLTLGSEEIIAKTTSEDVPKIGDEIAFSFEEEDMHLFDTDSKESLRK